MVAVNLTFSPSKTATAAAALGGIPAGTGATTTATIGVGLAQHEVNVWELDLAAVGLCTESDILSVDARSFATNDASSSEIAVGTYIFVGDSATISPWGTASSVQGFNGGGIVNLGAVQNPGAVPIAVGPTQFGATWSGPPTATLDVLVLVDAASTEIPLPGAGTVITASLPIVDVTFIPGSPCLAAADPVPVDNTASSTVGTPAVVDVSLNDDNTACDPLPGCAVYNTTVVVDPASTATGITASVDNAGVATVEASGPGTAIIHVESGCSPSCDANGGDVAAWTTQTLTVTVTPAVTPGACVEVPVVWNAAATAALAGTVGVTAGTGGDTTADGVSEAVVNVFDIVPACPLSDVTSVSVTTTYLKSGVDHDPATDGGIVATGDAAAMAFLSPPTSPDGDTAPPVAFGFAGGVSRDFTAQGGAVASSGDPLGATWSVPPGQTVLQVAVLSVAFNGDAVTTVTAPKVCVTYAEGSPCAPEPLPCVEVPVTFSQADTDAIGLAFGIDPTTDPTSVEADADVAGKQTVGVWLIEIPEGCTGEVVSVQAAATVDISATMDPDEDGAFIAVVDSIVPPTGWGTLAPTTGDPNLQIPGSLSTGYVSSGGTAWPAGPSTVTLDGVWSAGTLPASTLALLVYADALGESPSGSNIRVNVPETVCVTFATENCPPAADPIPVDDTASTTTGTTITVDAAANDNNTPCDPLPGCAVYREGVPFVDPSSTATGITASIDAAGEVTFTATGAGVAILNVESGCSPTCDLTGADVTTWVTQTVTITVTEPTVPCAAQLVKTCLAETPIAGCAEYAGVPAATILRSVTGANGDVIPVGSVAHPASNGVGSDGSGYIRSYYTNFDGTVVTPDAGTFTPGGCPTASPSIAFTAGGASIGSGVYAATLGPDGTSWSAPTGLRSLTVAARKTSTTDVTGSAVNRIDVALNGGTFRLLEGETFTWSVDDPDSIVAGSVNCVGDAAAAVVWVAI